MINHENLLNTLSEETRELYGEGIDEMDGFPDENDMDEVLNFIHYYVNQNRPVIFRNAVRNWKAFEEWDFDYLNNILKDKEISVACTPNGKADAVNEGLFVKPMEVKMNFKQFVGLLIGNKKDNKEITNKFPMESFNGMTSENTIFYAQHQNSSLTKEYIELIEDVPDCLEFAVKSFNNLPDAVNIWIGDSNSTSSLHKDPFENIYCVLRGKKIFTIYPPNDIINVPYKKYKEAHYHFENNEWKVIQEDSSVPWIDIDPEKETYEEIVNKYDRYKFATPYRVVLEPGDAFYLPSLWIHQVAQEHDEDGKVIAVNYWHDMQYGYPFLVNHYLCNIQLEKDK
ncbi:hypothetical protein ABK040_005448 [Willaertia magna]